MIIKCPACGTRYHVDENALQRPAGRTVRCANCGHTWHQSAPAELDIGRKPVEPEDRIEPALEVPPRPGASRGATPMGPPMPRPPSGRRRKRQAAIRWLIWIVVGAIALFAGIMFARYASAQIDLASLDRSYDPLRVGSGAILTCVGLDKCSLR
jgi:predicted Zn finger-like uncharacterized protein